MAIYHTRFAFEHKPKTTTLPGMDTQTLPTPCMPDSQPRVKDLQPWQVSPAWIYNPPTPFCPGNPCQSGRGSWSDRNAQLDLWSRQILQVESNCSLQRGNKPCIIYTSFHLPFRNDILSSLWAGREAFIACCPITGGILPSSSSLYNGFFM